MNWYAVFRVPVRCAALLLTRPTVTGLENVPRKGAFFLLPNHLSVLDPVLVQGFCPRQVHSLTKSTQFASGKVSRWLLPRVNAIPTRRYQVDPQVVRTVLRTLARGEGVCIYPEGERSWDGTLQPLRRGTIRLLLKAGAPIVPCGISGSFEARPRWGRRFHRRRVFLRFGEPIRFGVHDTRAERERALAAATERIEAALLELGAAAPGGLFHGPWDANFPSP